MSVSNSTNSVLQNSGSILRALDAASNWRALLLTVGSGIVFIIVTAIGASLAAKMGAFWVAGLFSLLAIGLLAIGLSATGFIMMDTAQNAPARSLTDALISSVFSIHRLLLSLLVLVVAYVVWILVLSLILYVCKIPGLGATLYTVVFPLGIVISGVFTIFLLFSGIGIIAPSVWDGGSVMDTLARLWAIAKERFMPLVILSLLLGFLVTVVNMLVFGVIFSGISLVTGLSAQILGSSLNIGISPDLLGMLMSGSLGHGMGDSGYFIAALIGGGILMSIVFAIASNVYLLGACINYLQLTDGLDISSAQRQIQEKLDEAKRRAEAAKNRAQELHQQQQAKRAEAKEAESSKTVSPSSPENAFLSCHACGTQISPDDLFCESCGTKLR